MTPVSDAVERAIATMWSRYTDPLSLDDLARSAILSKFHFSRVFRSFTGTSPGRFLSAIRLYQAKRMLHASSLSVTDIAYTVGYNSLGTFASRFTRSVGIPPGRYRALTSTSVPVIGPCEAAAPQRSVRIRGAVAVPETDVPMRIYIGAFNGPIIEGRPSAHMLLDSPGRFDLVAEPGQVLFLRAAAVPLVDAQPFRGPRAPLFVGSSRARPIRIHRDVEVDLTLHATGRIDPPILLALPELDNHVMPDLRRQTV